MKNNTLLLAALGTACVATGSATAGDELVDSITTGSATVANHLVDSAGATESKLTGSVSLDYNSHFISYGLDVWGGGDNLTDEDTFNPSVSINYQINDALSVQTGFWLDINDNDASFDPGSDFDTQETDTWVGVTYTHGIASYSATYQSWNYAGDTEEILDFAVAFDTFLSPSLLIHVRSDAGAANSAPGSEADEGTFAVLSASHSFSVTDRFSVSVPVAVGFALDSFHTSEDGYAYTSVGLQGSYALDDAASINFGLTYYNNDDAVTGNLEENFITTNVGISYSF